MMFHKRQQHNQQGNESIHHGCGRQLVFNLLLNLWTRLQKRSLSNQAYGNGRIGWTKTGTPIPTQLLTEEVQELRHKGRQKPGNSTSLGSDFVKLQKFNTTSKKKYVATYFFCKTTKIQHDKQEEVRSIQTINFIILFIMHPTVQHCFKILQFEFTVFRHRYAIVITATHR